MSRKNLKQSEIINECHLKVTIVSCGTYHKVI